MRTVNANVKLARNWTVKRVRRCLDKNQKHELVRFLDERYRERFFDPITCLRSAENNERGFGFAIMALCCLLIETLECYREGLPTSHPRDLKDLCDGLDKKEILKRCGEINPTGSEKVFENFFNCEKHRDFFPGVNGAMFYEKIRCGLLHQAQTKGGWRIGRRGSFWDANKNEPGINRDEFCDRLNACFSAFLDELRTNEMTEHPWPNVKQKICWLVETS